MSLKKIGLKIVLCGVDLEASQRIRSPSPSWPWHMVILCPDEEGWEALEYPSPRGSLVTSSYRTKSLGEKQLLFHRFYDTSPECLHGKIKHALLVPEEKVGLFLFLWLVTKFMWIIACNFPCKCRFVFSKMSCYSPWTSSNASVLFWERDTWKCTYSTFGQ